MRGNEAKANRERRKGCGSGIGGEGGRVVHLPANDVKQRVQAG